MEPVLKGFKDIEQAHNPCGLQRRTFDYMEESTEDGCKNSFCTLGGNHKCMQPKDYVEKTPENNIKLQRRLNKMAKELTLQKTAVIAGSQMTQTLPSRSAEDGPLSTSILTNSEDVLLPEDEMEDCLNSSYDYLWRTGTLKRRRKDVAEHACDTWTDTHVSMSASHGNEQKSLTPKRGPRSLTKKQVIQPTSDDRLSFGKEYLKFPEKDQKNKKRKPTSIANERSLLKGFGDCTPSKKTVQLNTVPALIDSLSNSPVNSEDLNACSLDKSFPVDRNDCVLEDKRRKKLQTLPSLKLAFSELGASGSVGFLQAVTTRNKSYCTEEASYEDFFSSSNSNENEVQIQVPKESQNPPEVCCKDSSTSMDLHDVSFCEPHNTIKKSRKISISVNNFPVEEKTKPAKQPQSIPLNISGGEKDDTGEALHGDDVNRLTQHAPEKSYSSVNDCARTTAISNLCSDEDEIRPVRVAIKKELLARNVKLKDSLGCSDHEMLEFKLTTLNFRRMGFGFTGDLLGRVP
ncbi:microcephalin 1 [Turdus rufiventris]|nr:microcephalin 1 [Turdus rufiventris]